MIGTKIKFSDGDNALADFAKAIALPVRIAIIRMIINSGNSLSKGNLLEIPYHNETVNKHVAELKSLGIVKAHGLKGNITFSIDQDLFNQMAKNMIQLLDQPGHKTNY